MGDSPEGTDLPPWQEGEEGSQESRPSSAEMEAAGQSALFGGAETPAENPPEPVAAVPQAPAADAATPAPPGQPYRVLARKYRPQTFAELIGQEPMVRTLANAIERDRLAHAFLMTGVRGVGKTSTARLIAKALNCIGPDGNGGPTIDPCGVCEPCRAIAEGRHIDVIEMDAASHTGVDDVREIIEAVRYSAVSARYKIYIIDEVHMLSRNAFNALLKTLEEPPAHVKFLFATTEVDKLPITVLSRTQRFDLRRIPHAMLVDHFGSVCRQEGVEIDDEALSMIASAAEGSVRDGLSILDQAIAHADMEASGSGTRVRADRVRDMLGLADKGAQRRLFGAILDGDPKALLQGVAQHYALGVEPVALMRGLMELAHRIAVTQVGESEGYGLTEEEVQAMSAWAGQLSTGQVHRLWQLLLKGYEEVRTAPDPLVALQMALLRVLHAADMPDPGKLEKLLRDLASNGSAGALAQGSGAGGASAALSWPALCDRVEQTGRLRVAQVMRDWVRVIELAPQVLVFATPDDCPEDPAPDLRDALLAVTDKRWEVSRGAGEGAATLREQAEAQRQAERERIRSHPLVRAAIDSFPGAEFVEEEDAPVGNRNWNTNIKKRH